MEDHVFYHPQIAAYYLQEMHNRQHAQKKMRVVFLVQDASVWDKQSPVYDVLAQDEEADVIIVLLPTYRAMDAEAGRCAGRYDEDEWHFFMTNILTSMISPMFLISVFWSRTIFFSPFRMRGCVCSVGRERQNSRRSQSFAIFPMGHREQSSFCKVK